MNMELLRNAELKTYPVFSLHGYTTYAKLLSNYDGDTANIVFIYNDRPMHVRARFYGYDCSEMKPSLNDPNRDEKKKKAILAKKYLWTLCTNNEDDNECNKSHKTLIKIKCGEYDKYGRLLITAFNEKIDIEGKDDKSLFELSINNQMIKEGHGYAYYGGTKENF